MSKHVVYFRISAARQGHLDVGREAQQAALLRFLPNAVVRVAD